jgi:hypothetical protein
MSSPHILNVLYTVDTEFWPRRSYVRASDWKLDYERDVLGRTERGDFGLEYQLQILDEYGLRGVFLVEALCGYAVGTEAVLDMVCRIRQHGQDVQLHLHPEWLRWMPQSILPGRGGHHMRDFSRDEQVLLIDKGIEMLRRCGADQVCAFRAGGFGANLDTLDALSRNGLRYDTSYNDPHLRSACDMRVTPRLLQPRSLNGVVEVPVTFMRVFGNRHRRLQLDCCSSGEIERTLLSAWRQRWTVAVIVSHSFEFIRGRDGVASRGTVDPIVLRRFQRLCRFLAEHRDKFRTTTFRDASGLDAGLPGDPRPPHARTADTLWRMLEQAWRRVTRPRRETVPADIAVRHRSIEAGGLAPASAQPMKSP